MIDTISFKCKIVLYKYNPYINKNTQSKFNLHVYAVDENDKNNSTSL